MARPPKADYVRLMIDLVSKKLLTNQDVKIADIATELKVSPALVHFYFHDIKTLVDAAWQSIFMAYVNQDLDAVDEFAPGKNWEGVKKLIDEIFSPEREAIHFAHARALANRFNSEEFNSVVEETHESQINLWNALMDKYTKEGVVDPVVDPKALALLFIAAPLGIALVKPELSAAERKGLAETWLTMIQAVMDPDFKPYSDR
jgi:AcrR family transcriptional regulator